MYLQIRFACGVTFHQKSLERAGVTERFLLFLCLSFWMLHFLIDLFDWESVNHQQQCFQDLEWSLMALWQVSMVTKTLPLWPLLPNKPVTCCRFFFLPSFWFSVTVSKILTYAFLTPCDVTAPITSSLSWTTNFVLICGGEISASTVYRHDAGSIP